MYFSHRSTGSSTCPSASMTSYARAMVSLLGVRDAPRSPRSSLAGSSHVPSVPPGRRSDHTVALERVELGLAEAEQLAVDFGVVLAQQRGTHHLRRRVRQLHGVAGHRVRAAAGMLELGDEAGGLQVRVGQ